MSENDDDIRQWLRTGNIHEIKRKKTEFEQLDWNDVSEILRSPNLSSGFLKNLHEFAQKIGYNRRTLRINKKKWMGGEDVLRIEEGFYIAELIFHIDINIIEIESLEDYKVDLDYDELVLDKRFEQTRDQCIYDQIQNVHYIDAFASNVVPSYQTFAPTLSSSDVAKKVKNLGGATHSESIVTLIMNIL